MSPPHRHPAAAFLLLSVHRIQVGLGSPAGARSMACPAALTRGPHLPSPPLPCTLPLNANRPGRFKLTCRASRFQPSQQQRKTRKVRCPLPMPSPRAHFKFRNKSQVFLPLLVLQLTAKFIKRTLLATRKHSRSRSYQSRRKKNFWI